MIRSFDKLTGNGLESWFLDFFRNQLQFKYYASPGQIELNTLDPAQRRGQHLELDGILLINKTCILLEFTSLADNFRNKIRKFTRNCNLFITSRHLNLRQKFELFGVLDEELDDFEDVDNFKYLYIGTNNAFENEHLSRNDFPDFPNIQRHLFIFKPTHVEYLRQLTNLINIYARNDFYSALGFTPGELGEDDTSIHLDFIKADGKYITSGQNIRADIYQLKLTIKELLSIARVSRYEGIPFILDENKNENFQRFLIEQKLSNISSNFITNQYRKCFPNTITLVLSRECREEVIRGNTKLTIPKKYSSIDILDGQHRLFAYTRNGITDAVRERSEILATAIKFRSTAGERIANYSAKVFCEINANQAKVKNNLIYLIKFDVLGDVDEVALAGKILLECNKGNSALSDIFFTNTLRKRNKLNLPAVPVTTIIDNDLTPFLKGVMENRTIDNANFRRIFGNTRNYFLDGGHLELVNSGKAILERYFNYIASTFNLDWHYEAFSHIISSKYISAFIRLLRYKLFSEGLSVTDMQQVLLDLKEDVDAITQPNNSPSFPKNSDLIPSTKFGINTIFGFLNDPSSFTPEE